MYVMHTRYGALMIPERRQELNSWGIDESLAWLTLNDPNGEWPSYVEDYEWAVSELGPLSAEELRDAIWEQSQDI